MYCEAYYSSDTINVFMQSNACNSYSAYDLFNATYFLTIAIDVFIQSNACNSYSAHDSFNAAHFLSIVYFNTIA